MTRSLPLPEGEGRVRVHRVNVAASAFNRNQSGRGWRWFVFRWRRGHKTMVNHYLAMLRVEFLQLLLLLLRKERSNRALRFFHHGSHALGTLHPDRLEFRAG